MAQVVQTVSFEALHRLHNAMDRLAKAREAYFGEAFSDEPAVDPESDVEVQEQVRSLAAKLNAQSDELQAAILEADLAWVKFKQETL